MSNSTGNTRRLVGMSILTALVVVLQVVATFIKPFGFSFTLALTPIVVGAALYGSKSGAWLGGVFGVVVLLMCIFGADAGGAILWNVNPAMTAVLCIVKGAAAGWVTGLVYNALNKKKMTARVISAAICTPIVNTGIFCLGMALFFHDKLVEWAAGANLVYFVFIGLIGLNFLIEMVVNVALSPIIVRIIDARGKEIA